MVTVYGSKNGHGCRKTTELLTKHQLEFTFKIIDVDISTSDLLIILLQYDEGFTGLPVIIFNGELLTYRDLKRRLK